MDDDDDGEVLVGLGLYDPPEPAPLYGSAPPKILKLIESWQPPEQNSDDDADGEDDDSEDDELPLQEPLPSHSAPTPLAARQEAQHLGRMAGQSFFFEDQGPNPATSQMNQPKFFGTVAYGW